MLTKFSQFNNGGAVVPGDIIVGLRNGQNTAFNASALPTLPWTTLLVGQPLLINEGYFMANGAPASFPLPTVAAPGGIIQIVNVAGFQVNITQAAGQQIHVLNNASTIGVGGSLQSNTLGDSIILVCDAANTTFFALGAPGGIWNIF